MLINIQSFHNVEENVNEMSSHPVKMRVQVCVGKVFKGSIKVSLHKIELFHEVSGDIRTNIFALIEGALKTYEEIKDNCLELNAPRQFINTVPAIII